MALGSFNLFSWKSKETREREQREYEKWAFPHGQEQRSKIEALLKELMPKTDVPFLLMGYLTSKELYEDYLKKFESSEKTLDYLINEERKYRQILKKDEMTTYLAIVIAELEQEADENLEYPTADELRERIKELEKIRRKR